MIKKNKQLNWLHVVLSFVYSRQGGRTRFSALGLGTDGPKCNDYKIPTFKIV